MEIVVIDLSSGGFRFQAKEAIIIGETIFVGEHVRLRVERYGDFPAEIRAPAGSLPGVTQTVPLAVYQLLEDDPAAAYALSGVLLLVSVALVAGLRARLR